MGSSLHQKLRAARSTCGSEAQRGAAVLARLKPADDQAAAAVASARAGLRGSGPRGARCDLDRGRTERVQNGPMKPQQSRSRILIRRAAPRVLLGLCLFALACTGPTPPPGVLEVLPARLSEDGARLIALSDGDTVDLVRPIQGGHVLFIGALLRHPADGDGTLRGELRRVQPDGTPGPIIVYDERTTSHQALAADTPAPGGASDSGGWRQVPPDINSIANIPVCPDFLDLCPTKD